MTDPRAKAVCRDCLHVQACAKRCRACGSPRILMHPELETLTIAHVDCDAFYAAVEKRDNPQWRDKPLIIGGGRRGVVATACYIARINGVHSAMPMYKALKACPDAIVVKPDMNKYVDVSRQIRACMERLTPLMEPLSIDEAFLDLSGTVRFHRQFPAHVLTGFAKTVEREIGITVSIGLSYCKFLAKMASDMQKPRGFSVIGRSDAHGMLGKQPVSAIWGVGRAFARTLAGDGITMISQLQRIDRDTLLRRYGTIGDRLYFLSRGIDNRRVTPERADKSISSETTFNEDIARLDELAPVLRSLSEKVSARLKRKDRAGHTIVLKLKTKDFQTRTRNRRLTDATLLADRIFRTGLELLKKETDGTSFRLLGVGVTDLTDATKADPPDLVDLQATRRATAESAMDRLRERYGTAAIETGYTFGRHDRSGPQREKD